MLRDAIYEGMALMRAASLARAIIALKRDGHTVEWDADDYPRLPDRFCVDGKIIDGTELLRRASA